MNNRGRRNINDVGKQGCSVLMLILQSRLFRKVYRNIYPLKFGNLYLLRRAMSTMSLEIKSSAGVVLLTVEHLKKHNIQLDTTTGSKTFIKVNNTLIEGENNVSRYLARKHVEVGLYGSSPVESSQVDSWLDFSHLYLKNTQDLTPSLKELNRAIGQASHIVGPTLTLADFSVYAALQGNPKWCNMLDSGKAGESVSRWYKSCINQDTFKVLQNTLTTKKSNNEKSNKSKNVKPFMEEGGKFVELPGVKDGEVVVRFPPEASGYLHIGHAKAALLNQYYKDHYKGKLIMRFDDTNPAKENAHYEKIILEDIQLLQLTPDKYSRTSDYFDEMFVYAEQLIRQGDAYVDDTPAEEMRAQRDQRLPSPKRDLSVEENMRLFQEMKQGTPTGLKNCLRAKIDYASDNGCMRDPVLYRCRDEAHVEHGTKYKAYPTYDFACPIVDSVEGVTHAMRTTEYLDRDVQYQWIIKKLGIRGVQIYSYSRLALINTVLSKRKLTYLVDEGFVDGWDDPRFPTVRGVLRRGMTIEGLKEFIVAQGSSKSNVHMEWDKIWAFNKKVIDPVAPRYNALLKEQVVPVTVHGAQESSEEYPKHPKNEAVGKKPVYYSSKVFVEGEDAELMKEGDLVTFINWGNLRITKVNKKGEKISSLEANLELDNKDFKKTLKITWLAEHSKAPFIPTKCTFFQSIIEKADMTREDNFKDHIRRDTKSVSDMLGDPCLADVKKGDIIQLQRRGYFICDEPYQPPSRHSCKEAPCILFHIPDGSTAGMMNQGKGDKSNVKTSSSTKTADSKPKGSNKQQKEKSASSTTSAVPVEHTGEQQALFDSIVVQGDKIRNLKAAKASKETITAEVTILKDLKAKYKDSTGREFTPPPSTAAPSTKTAAAKPAKQQSAKLSTKASSVNHTEEQQNLFDSIVSQGDKIRNLKSAGATTEQVSSQVAILKDLKLRYKASTGVEFVNPSTSQQPQKKGKGKMAPTPVSNTEPAKESTDVENLKQKISEQGDKIRQLKSANTAKVDLQPEINILIQLKSDYKELAGTEYKPPGGAGNQRKGKEKKANEAKPKEKVQLKKEEKPESEGGLKKVTRLGLEAKKEDSLHDWYTQVITKAELIEYYDVSGCYILRPWAYGIWEKIKDWFDANIKSLGVENCYFPMFVSQAALEKEKEHIADFAPEVAWVTKSGQSELAEPIAVRPTSETAMYPAYAKWVQSHRDLPLRLNQWCNVVRWEFKHPQPFLRTREFLWQEGHTAFADYEEACKEVHTIVDWYEQIYTDLLAIPVVKGRKTEKEKFAGGVFTITVEAYIQASGRAIQGATSHHLGQNFSRMFDIAIEDPNKPDSKEKLFVYQNCWGITTRTIGVLIMVHGDNKGLVLPPRVANLQVVIVPVGITATTTDETRNLVKDTCIEYENKLKAAGVRVRLDNRENYSPGWKFNHWELKGVPIRIELGPRDIEKNEFVAVRRDTGEKISMKKESFATQINELLDTIQSDMFKKASKQLEDNLTVATSWETFLNMLDRQKIIQAPFCGGISCEEKIKKDSAREEATDVGAPSMGAKSLCIPLKQPGKVDGLKCVYPSCGKPATCYTLFGRSY